jgi:uncharacterized protein (TIGR00255 family)
MTGFAAAGLEDAGHRVNVTVKTVNHRFLDVAVKAPHALAPIEARLKALVQQRLARGRAEVTVVVDATTPAEREVVIDEALIDRVAAAFDGARARGVVTGGLTVSDILRMPQVVEIRPTAADVVPGAVPDVLAALVERVTAGALLDLVAMRETEGAHLERDLDARIGGLAGLVGELERRGREGQAGFETRLRERLAVLPSDVQGDPAAAAQEVVRFVARSDIDEELVRLRGHLDHWRALAASEEPCGRKLDFLVQEMNREINTIGSKIEGPNVSEVVIAAKAELERIREQVQNVE